MRCRCTKAMAVLLLMCSLLQLVLMISCVSANAGVGADGGADAGAGAATPGQVQTPAVLLHVGNGCMKLNARAHTSLVALLLDATCKTFDSEHCMRAAANHNYR